MFTITNELGLTNARNQSEVNSNSSTNSNKNNTNDTTSIASNTNSTTTTNNNNNPNKQQYNPSSSGHTGYVYSADGSGNLVPSPGLLEGARATKTNIMNYNSSVHNNATAIGNNIGKIVI